MSPKQVRHCLGVIVALSALLLSVTLAAAQGPGTPNVEAAAAYVGPTRAFADVRWFEGSGNQAWSVGFQGKLGNTSEAKLTLLDMDNEGEDPIAGVVRRSAMQLLAVETKFELCSGENGGLGISLNPGLEITTSRPRGTNLSTGAFARDDDCVIPTCSLPIQWNWGSWNWMVEPKAAWFETQVPTSRNTTVEGLGTCIGIGIGVRFPVGGHLSLFGDITPILDGNNSMNKDTNKPEDKMVWGAGGTIKLGNATNLTIFGTTAAGSTTSTSLLAAPDDSVSFGVKLDRDL
jgi:hypothetical protein